MTSEQPPKPKKKAGRKKGTKAIPWMHPELLYVQGEEITRDGKKVHEWPTQPEVAERFGIGIAALVAHAQKHKWTEKRERYQKELEQRIIEESLKNLSLELGKVKVSGFQALLEMTRKATRLSRIVGGRVVSSDEIDFDKITVKDFADGWGIDLKNIATAFKMMADGLTALSPVTTPEQTKPTDPPPPSSTITATQRQAVLKALLDENQTPGSSQNKVPGEE